MKNYVILFLFIGSIQGLCQEKKDTISPLQWNENNYFVKYNPFDFKLKTTTNSLNNTPHHKKLDIYNSNYPTYTYDIFNPNKSTTVIDFVLAGITNLF